MENQLIKKLQIKAGFKVCVINAPENFQTIVGELPGDVNFSFGETEDYNALLIFAITKTDMLEALDSQYKQVTAQTICWIIYPKAKSKLASDLNLMQSWDALKVYHLEPCASAAIDGVWTALRIKPEGTTKKSGLANEDIAKNDYGDYIDIVRKIVTLPEEINTELIKTPVAFSNYEKLSYSNKKEYVLWVLSAKQEKTKTDRMNKMVEKLLAGKKNPTDK